MDAAAKTERTGSTNSLGVVFPISHPSNEKFMRLSSWGDEVQWKVVWTCKRFVVFHRNSMKWIWIQCYFPVRADWVLVGGLGQAVMAVWLFIYWARFLSCHADSSHLLGSVTPEFGQNMPQLQLLSPFPESTKCCACVVCSELKCWWIPVDSHLWSVFPTWSKLVSLSLILFISCSLPVTLSGVCRIFGFVLVIGLKKCAETLIFIYFESL